MTDTPDPARLGTALNLLKVACKPGDSVVDLGCLHGAYTIAFAQAGYLATGIEARPASIARCREAGAGVDGLRFIEDDVRNLARHGEFDAVWCCGLLYHLDQPVDFLGLLGKVTRRLLIVQTHISLEPDSQNEGRRGHWYGEGNREHPWSSWGNECSFWLAKDDLLDAIQDAGFDLVFELHDHVRDIRGAADRVMVAALKTP